MPRKRHTGEQIIGKLREAEVELAGGHTIAQACRKIGVSEQTPSAKLSVAAESEDIQFKESDRAGSSIGGDRSTVA